ncbi:MAG: radical SAM protein, partial [Angelakisella sp.]
MELSSLTLPGLTAWMATLSEPAFRAKQLYGWLHQKQVTSFDAMSNLSLPLRSKLSENGFITKVSTIQRLTSRLDGTNKFLMELSDGNCVEAVWMEYKHGVSLCISTQVGCRQGCTFCASTLGGLLRNLTPGEMLGEIYEAQRQMGKQISTLVLMGIGEPLDNFDAVMDFLTILSSAEGQNMSLRHVSLSTCGLVPEIRRLMEKN